jgi:hypothetical protein
MSGPGYPAARKIAPRIYQHFLTRRESTADESALAPLPGIETIESIIDIAFWTSLRREEQFPPRISLTYLPPDQVPGALIFEKPIPLLAESLTKIAPGVERPAIHLGIWSIDGELKVWGATRQLPTFSFVAETVAPGLLVIKHRHNDEAAKFINVAVLEGDTTKMLNHEFKAEPGCASILSSMLGTSTLASMLGTTTAASYDSSSVMIRLAVSMRDHKRGGSLLIVPRMTEKWRKSISHPISYSVSPPYTELSDVLRGEPEDRKQRRWKEALVKAVDGVAGLTAIDGATVVTEDCEVLAFGAKIVRPDGVTPAEKVALIEPAEGAEPIIIPIGQLGGTRHISAVQFANAQRDSLAMVASQDGPFTIFYWSNCDQIVYGYRVESLLL